jgi:hypothetical protein
MPLMKICMVDPSESQEWELLKTERGLINYTHKVQKKL